MAKDLKAQLEIGADVTGVEAGIGKAKKSLASLGATAATEGKKAAEGIESIGRGSDAAARKVERDQKSLINSIQRTTAAMESGGRGSAKYYELLASQRGVDAGPLKPYLDQLRAVETAQAAASASLGKGGIVLDKYGMSAKQTAAALRGVPAQLTDIAVSLQGGQNPLTVFLQQGGQLKDMFGGVVPAAKALGGAVLGLVSPFTLAASAVAALGFAYFQGSKEVDAFNRSITFSGNAAGVTTSQLRAMAQSIDAIAGTESAAAAALAEFVANGNIASANLERFTLTAVRMEKVTGQAISETVKQFAELGKSPVDAAVKLNESTNFLTTSLYQQIRALEEQGKTAQAATLAQKSYADALDARLAKTEGQLGTLERAWRGIVSAAKEGWDAMLGVGRAATLQEQIAKAEEALNKRRSGLGARSASGQAGIAAEQARIDVLKESLRLESSVADRQREAAAQVKARVTFDKEGDQFLTNRAKMEKAIAEARNQGKAAGASQLEIDKRISDIRAKFADKGAAKTALQIDKAELNQDLAAFKSASEKLIGTYAGSERILESIRSAGLLGDREYYEAKRGFINLEAEAKDRALQQEIDRLGQERLTGKDKIDNDRKIAEAAAKQAIVRADASSQLVALDIQEAAAKDRLTTSLLSLRQAAEDYFQSQNRQQDRVIAGIGQGGRERGRDAGISQIEDRYDGQRREAANQRSLAASIAGERGLTSEQERQFAARLALIDEFQRKSIASFTSYYDRLTATQGNWALGAQEALRNYADESADVFSQVGDLVTRSFRGMEDALIGFVKTGKLDFKSLADSIIADLARIAAKKLITGIVGSLFGGGDFGSGSSFGGQDLGMNFEGGGYTGAGSRSGGLDGRGGFMAMVHPNETVIDHSKGGGMGVTLNVINQTGTQVQGSVQQRGNAPDGTQMLDLVLTAVADTINAGSGPVTRAMESRFGLRTSVS